MSLPSVVFVVNLLQDVNVLRPLVFLAARETGAALHFLVSARFARRDVNGTWATEIAELARRVGADTRTFGNAAEAFMALQGGRGILIAGSESNLPAHADVHEVFRTAPSGYLRITLQHGLECVGLLQAREHVMAYGEAVTFAADVVCAWMEPSRLVSLHSSQRAKILVTGPASLLSRPEHGGGAAPSGGLVCENLHSPRLRASGDHGRSYMETFERFCEALAQAGETTTLRPHPAGPYTSGDEIRLAPNVRLNVLPMYRLDLAAYGWGISAPSTVVLDMVLAGVPVGVWQDSDGLMDLTTYDGLRQVSALEDWLGLVRDAQRRPEAIVSCQRRWLRELEMPLDPADVYRRFAELLVGATTFRRRAVRAGWRVLPKQLGRPSTRR